MKNRFFNFCSYEEGRKCPPLQFKRKSSLARFAAMLLMLMTMSVGQVWAWEFNYPTVYFYTSSNDNWDRAMLFVYRNKGNNDEGSKGWNMNKIPNTQLWQVKAEENWGNSLSGFIYGIGATAGWSWEGGNNWSSRWKYLCDNYSHTGTSQTDLPYGTYYMTSTASNNLSVVKLSSNDQGYTSLNKEQALRVRVSTDGGSTYKQPTNLPAIVNIHGYKLTNATTAGAFDVTKNAGERYGQVQSDAAITSTCYAVVSGLQSGWQFDGFWDAESGGNKLSSETTYGYVVSEAKTIYPRFSRIQYTFTSGSTWYFDFSQVECGGSNGVNWPTATTGSNYDDSGCGSVKSVTFTQNRLVSLGEGWGDLKTQKGEWSAIVLPSTAPAPGQNSLIVSADGKTATWGTYSPCTTGAPSIAWATTPADGIVGGNMTARVTADGTVEWTSSNTAVADVNNSGVITYKAEGSTTICATVTNANYCTSTASVEKAIRVSAAGPVSHTWTLFNSIGKVGDFVYDEENNQYTLDITITDQNKAAWYYKYDNATRYYTGAENPLTMAVTLVAGDGALGWGQPNGTYTLTIKNYSGTWKVSASQDCNAYTLRHTTQGYIATFTLTANANEYDLTFELRNDIINNLYVEDNCGNTYGCSTAIQPGQSITLTTALNTFNFERAAQNNHWHYTFNSQTKLLSCDAQSEEQKAGTTYLIQFLNYNGGAPLQSGQVEEGQTPVYNGATPTRESDAEWDYTFERWEPALYAADKAQDYTAIYTQTRRQYTLTWDFAGGATTTPEAEYTHGSVANGAAITAPATPTKSGAVFTGWSPAVAGTMPAENTTYTAQWKTLQNIYVVGRFTIDDGNGNLTYTGNSDRGWNDSSTKIKFAYDETTGYYKLETHRSVAQLASGESGNKYYFRFMEGSTKYGAGSQNLAPGLEGDKKTIGSSNSNNFVFNTSDNAAADDVVLWIDWDNKKFWYSATAEQTYAVTINNGDHGTVSSTGEQQVGKSGISITATPADGYKFVRWEVSGGASVASETSATTTLTATAAGSATATWATQEYMYIYAALASNWEASNLAIKYNGVEYGTTSSYFVHLFDGSKTLYDAPGSTATTQVAGKTYKVAIFKVPTEWADGSTHIFVGKDGYTYDAGVLQSGNGYLYYKNDNRAGVLESISIASVTVDKASYEPAEQVTCSLTLNDYTQDHKTAGADGLVYSYKLNNLTDGTSSVIDGQTTRTCKFTANTKLTVDKTYTITAIVKDNQTGKMVYEQTTTEFSAIAAVPRVSATAVSTLVLAGHDGQVKLDITTQNTAAGWKYSVKNETNGQWLAQNIALPAENSFRWTATGSVPAGAISIKVYLYNGSDEEQAVSDAVVVNAETAYGIAVNYTGQGSVTPAEVFASASVSSAEVTATPASHYYFKEWTATTGIAIADASATTTTVTATQGGTLTATFTPSWDLRGDFNGWSGTANQFVEFDGENNSSIVLALTAGQTINFKIHHHSNSTTWYTTSSAFTFTRANAEVGATLVGKDGSNIVLKADIAGDYVFHFNTSSKKLTVTYPTPQNYTITYIVNGGSEIAEHLTYTEVEATFSLPVPTRSGYWFHGWYTNEACTEGKTTQIVKGTTGNKTFYAKWDPVGYYLNINLNPGGDANWQKLYFEDGTLELPLVGRKNYEFSLLKRSETQEYWYGINKDGDKTRTIESDANWYFYSGQANVQIHTTIDGKYVLEVTDGDNPQIQFTYPKWSCEFSIPALVNTLQPSTVSFTPTVVNFGDVTYELYYTNDGGANWTSCAYTGAGTYSYTNTYATAGTYQLKVVVKNGAEPVGEPFLSSEFTVVEPTINIAVSAYPRVEQTVTVTPTVTGLQTPGTYHYCWSIVDETIDFTDNGDGTFSFTAPAVAGTYTIRLEVKPGSDCSAAAIVSKDQEVTILGDYIVINMKRDPETLWKLENYIYYYKNSEKNAEWPGVQMTFLGKDEDDYPWYTYTIQGYTAYAGGTMVFNDNGSGNMHQTGNIEMPQTDGCYYVKANLDGEWRRQWQKIDDCPDLTRRVVLLSETENQYQGVTYTIKGKAVFFTGNEIKYTYSARIKNGAEVDLDDHHSFIPATADADVTYVIAIRATSEVPGEDVTSEYEIVMKKNPTTLNITSGSLTLKTAMTLTTSRTENFENGTKFTYTVIEPGTHSQVTFSEVTINSNRPSSTSGSYTPKSTGTYFFNVVITKNGNQVGAAQYSAIIAPMKAWVKHNWDNSNWEWKEMTYRNDGTYAYYDANASNGSYFRSTTANATLNQSTPAGDSQAGATTTLNPDNVAKGTIAVYIYDVAANTLTVRPANNELRVYRIKSVCSDGTYYSNTVNKNGQEVSFYAQKNGSLVWQSRLSTDISADWEDGASIATPVLEDNVYTATATTLGSALSAPSVYYGGYTIYSPIVGGHATMTSFTPNPDAANEYFNNYYVLHANDGQAVATVGNEINHNLSTVLPYYELPQETNLRYAYNNKTNVFVRNYLANAVGNDSFLQLYGLASNLKQDDESTIINKEHPVKLIDQSNWVYTYDAKGVLGEDDKIMATIRATYNGLQSWILSASGLENDEDADIELLTSKISGAGTYTLRLIYDYKTNRLTAGWIPSGTMNEGVGETITQVRDILVQRTDDGETSQFSIAKGTVVAVDKMTTEFIITRDMWDSWSVAANAKGYKTMFFWFSLPYECQLWNVYGFDGAYKVQTAVDVASWEVQRYRGDLRANGTAGSSAWKRLSEYSTTEVNRGYVLAVKLKRDEFKEIKLRDDDPSPKSEIRFFFPSASDVTLSSTPTATLPANSGSTAEIQQGWNVMGVPVMKSNCGFTQEAEHPFEFVYRWSCENGERWYEPFAIQDAANPSDKKHFNFMSGHAYMVQVKGETPLNWNYTQLEGSAWAPARVAANGLTDCNLRVDLYYNDEMQDKTYIKYRTNGTRDYERGRDLEKIENAGRSMIYSELQDKLAAICLADTDYVQIPLTVVAAKNGEYVLQMPAAVGGVEPVLYDVQEGKTTMLNYDEYVVNLSAGTYKNRFFLSVKAKSPEITTSVESVGTEGDKVIKFIDSNNQLMILRGGRLYDAQGHMLK